MPPELEIPQGQATTVAGEVPPIQPPVEQVAAPAPADSLAPAEPTATEPPPAIEHQADGGVKVLAPSAYKRIKQEAMERGRRAALEEVNATLSGAGYQTMEELIAAAQERAKPKPIAKKPEPEAHPRQLDTLQKQVEAERKEKADATRRVRDLQRKLDAAEAERALERAAYQVGIKDTDYAIRLLTRKCDSMTDDELKAFDELKFFEGLKTTNPYLFQEVVQAATTGTGGSNTPAPPSAKVASAASAGNNQLDAMKMKPGEYKLHLRKRGLQLT